jgi:hypothetical protein
MRTLAKATQPTEITSTKTSRVTQVLANTIRILMIRSDSYRPELHYMRGRGPKWHAKNDPAPESLDVTRMRTKVNGVPAVLLQYPRWAVTLHARLAGFALLHHPASHSLAEAKLHIWR